MIPKFIFRQKQQRIPEKEELVETMCTRFKTCYRSTVSKTVWYWCTHTDRHTKTINQWKGKRNQKSRYMNDMF